MTDILAARPSEPTDQTDATSTYVPSLSTEVSPSANGTVASKISKGVPDIQTNGEPEFAGETVAARSMTGTAVSEEPIANSAKVVEAPDSISQVTEVPEMQASPAEANLEHVVAVDAPTSDLRASPSPAKNPAEDNPETGDIVSTAQESAEITTARPQTPVSPPAGASLPETRAKEEITQDNPIAVPTPPQSSRASSPKISATGDALAADSEMPDAPPLASTNSYAKHDRPEGPTEPQAKRARTDTGTSSPAVTFAEPDPQRKMTANRQKYCLTVLRQLKRGKDAAPFLVPVDPVKLKIPDYPKIVTNPQDLGTIENKLKKNDFESIDDFIDSVQLIWANCERYNGQESAINKMALRLKEQFERQIRSMPPPEVSDKSSPAEKGSKFKKVNKVPVSAPAKSQKSTSPAAPGGVPVIRRESMGYDGRPKREIHAPPPKSLPYQNAAPRRNKNALQLKFCASVLKELTKKSHEAYAYPFYVAVDAAALGLTDYHTVIRNPMDLGTIKEKLAAGDYESADDFEYDIRLMFRNCYKYNGAGSPVHAMGKRLENVFNERWAEKPIPRPEGYGSDSEEDSDVDDPNKQTVQMLTKQLEAMKNQIAGLNQQTTKKKKKTKRDMYDDDGMGPRDGPTSLKIKKFSGGRKGRDPLDDIDETPMIPTFEQKTALSTKMGYMTEHQMPVVIQILKRTDPNFDPEDEEVELDVDKVHPKTIRLLWNWIMEDSLPSFLRKKQPKAKKNRSVLSENEQQRQIEQLEQQLSRFNGGADPYAYDSRHGGNNIPNDDSSDDSDSSEEDD